MSLTKKKPAYKNSKTSSGNGETQKMSPRSNVFATLQQSPPPAIGVMAIDKLYLDLQLQAYELDAALDRARQLLRAGRLGKGSTQSTFFKNAFVLHLPSSAIVRFHMVANNRDKGAPMQIVLNPNQMENGDSELVKDVFKALFPTNSRLIATNMLIRRIDVCIQLGLPIDDLIINLEGVMSGAKVWVTTNRKGYVQTIYMGDVNSAHHGVAYDQLASDAYKRLVGEKPSRSKLRDNAELAIERKAGRTQLESRRNFEKPVTLAELAQIKAPFGNYRILELKGDAKNWDPSFSGYVDKVRLRGVHGARAHIQEQCGKSRPVTEQLLEWEARLNVMAAPWWKPEQYAASLLKTLRDSDAWQFLRVMS